MPVKHSLAVIGRRSAPFAMLSGLLLMTGCFVAAHAGELAHHAPRHGNR